MTQRTSVQKYSCDRCNVDYLKDKLRRQRGMLLCPDCIDDYQKTKPFNPHWRTPRLSDTPLLPVTSPRIYTITETGVTSLQQSQTFRRDGWKHFYDMRIVGDGAVTVTADPQLVAGATGDRMTLTGTSSTNTVTFVNGAGLDLQSSSITLGDGDSLSLVYHSSTGWVETSRNKN